MATPVKHYFTALGIRNAVVNFRQTEESHITENIICVELRMRGFHTTSYLVDLKPGGLP